jgi:cobalamin biosynthesis protein CobT
MMAEKDYESSDDDPDFEVPLEHESDTSSQSECENTVTETDDTYEKNHKRRRKDKSRKNETIKKQCFTTNSSDSNDKKISPKEEKARADSLWQSFLSDTGMYFRVLNFYKIIIKSYFIKCV